MVVFAKRKTASIAKRRATTHHVIRKNKVHGSTHEVQHDDMRVRVAYMMDGNGNSDRHGAIAMIIVLRFNLV